MVTTRTFTVLAALSSATRARAVFACSWSAGGAAAMNFWYSAIASSVRPSLSSASAAPRRDSTFDSFA